MKYSPKSTATLATLLNNLQNNLLSMQVYDLTSDDIKQITKKLRRYMSLFDKVKTEEELISAIQVRFC